MPRTQNKRLPFCTILIKIVSQLIAGTRRRVDSDMRSRMWSKVDRTPDLWQPVYAGHSPLLDPHKRDGDIARYASDGRPPYPDGREGNARVPALSVAIYRRRILNTMQPARDSSVPSENPSPSCFFPRAAPLTCRQIGLMSSVTRRSAELRISEKEMRKIAARRQRGRLGGRTRH